MMIMDELRIMKLHKIIIYPFLTALRTHHMFFGFQIKFEGKRKKGKDIYIYMYLSMYECICKIMKFGESKIDRFLTVCVD